MIDYKQCKRAIYLPDFFEDGYPTISPEEIDAYIDLKPEVVDAIICLINPIIESITALWYVFDDTTVTIDGMFFGYANFK